jgi:hypothetical protein
MRVRFNPKLLSSKGSFNVLAIVTGLLLLFLSGLLFADPAEARWRFVVFGVPGLILLIRGTGNKAFGKFTLLIDILIAAAIFYFGTVAYSPPPEMPEDTSETPIHSGEVLLIHR